MTEKDLRRPAGDSLLGDKRALPVDPKVEKRLLDFLEKHPGAHTDQIAKRLKLVVFDVHDALMELYRRGKVKPGHAC